MTRYPFSFQGLLPFLLAGSIATILGAIGYYAESIPVYWLDAIKSDALWWICVCVVLALVLRLSVPQQARALFCSVLVLYLAAGVGFEESATVLLFFSACYLYGRLLLGLVFPGAASAASGLTRPLLIGLAIQLTLFSLLIRRPLNFPIGYLAIQLAPLLLLAMTGQLPALLRQIRMELKSGSERLNAIPYWYCCALLVLLGLMARYAFYPSLSWDDNVGHLQMWTELTHNQQFTFDVVTQVWAVSPFAVNLMHSIVSLIAGADARGAFNLVLLALLLRQLAAIFAHLDVDISDRLLLCVLFVSTPLAAFLLVTLQSELFLALLATAGVRLALTAPRGWYDANMLALASVAALACATKLPGALLGVLLLSGALIRQWPLSAIELSQYRKPSKMVFMLALCGLGVLALNSYVSAWRITGNPFFPLYNGIFQSPYLEASNFVDERWLTGFSLASYWNVFFNTDEHYESRKFVAGFHYLFLLPLALPLVWRRLPARSALVLLVPLLGFGLAMFAATQYWRYLFPVLPLAMVAMAFLLVSIGGPHAERYIWPARVTMGLCLLLNFWFYPGISWQFAIPPSASDTPAERERLTWDHAPAKALTTYVSSIAPGSQVLYHKEIPLGATLHGDPIYLNWYSPRYSERAGKLTGEADVRSFMEDLGIDFVIWNMNSVDVAGEMQELVKDYLSGYGEPLLQASSYVLFRIQRAPLAYLQIFSSSDLEPIDAMQSLGIISTGDARVARFLTSFACASDEGYLVVTLNWDSGWTWSRLLPCSPETRDYQEAFVIPNGVRSADLYIAVQDASSALVSRFVMEVDEHEPSR